MEDIIIRPAKPEDAIALQTIMMKGRIASPAYQEVFGDNLSQCTQWINKEYTLKKATQLQNKGDDEHYTLIEHIKDKTILAVCHGYEYCKSEELSILIPHSEDYGELKGLYVDPTVQSKGMGSKLLQDFEQWLLSKGKKQCILRTLSHNTQSNGFYTKNGYQDTRKRSSLTIRGITAQLTIYTKDL